jgi:hypothetical protein
MKFVHPEAFGVEADQAQKETDKQETQEDRPAIGAVWRLRRGAGCQPVKNRNQAIYSSFWGLCDQIAKHYTG